MSIEYKCPIQYSTKVERIAQHFVTEIREQDGGIWFATINATIFANGMSERTDVLEIQFPTINFNRARY